MIGRKWSKIAKFWVGNKEGRHCHWCKFMESEDGEVHCGNIKSKVTERIRMWSGEECAKQCKCFKLNKWYEDDRNIEKIGVKNE